MIKTKVIKALSKVEGTFTRQDIQKQIWIAQGNKLETYVVRQGYYADALQEWVSQNLIQREDKGLYSMTDEGRLFVANRKGWLKKRREARNQRDEETRRRRESDVDMSVLTEELRNKIEAKRTREMHENKWAHLVGRKITKVRYLQPSECGNMGWNYSPLVLELDNKTCLIPQMDDEGNDGGAMLHYNYKTNKGDIIYVI